LRFAAASAKKSRLSSEPVQSAAGCVLGMADADGTLDA
jgi:hypothetical protein